MNFFHIKKSISGKLLAVALAIVIAVPSVFAIMPPPPAQATFSSCVAGYFSGFATEAAQAVTAAVFSVPVGTNGQIVSQAGQLGGQISSFFQNCIEHGLALMIGKMLLAQMTSQIVNYINSGFHGSSAFVGNPGKLFQNIGNQIVSNALQGISQGSLGFNICSPFRTQLLAGLAANFGINPYGSGSGGGSNGGNSGGDLSLLGSSGGGTSSLNSCSLSDVTNDVNDAYNNFQDWSTFQSLALNNDSNPIGAFLSGVNNIESQISDQVNNQLSELNWGNGFLSQEDCTHTDVDVSGGQEVDTSYSYTKTGGNGADTSATVASGSTDEPIDAPAGAVVIGQNGAGQNVYSDPNNDSCSITTPGQTIANTLQNQLNVPADQLGVADDLDKIFNALFNELLKTGLGALGLGPGGLASASTGGSGGGGVWNQIANQTQTQVQAEQATDEATENSVVSQLQAVNASPQGSTNQAGSGGSTNVAENKQVTATPGSRTGYDAGHLTDSNTTMTDVAGQFAGAITNSTTAINSFTIDLGQQTDDLYKVVVYPHNPTCTTCWGALPTFKVVISDQNNNPVWDSAAAGNKPMSTVGKTAYTLTLPQTVSGRYVTIQGLTAGELQLAEVQVFKDTGPTITINTSTFALGSVGQSLSTYDTGATAVDITGTSVPVVASYTNSTGATVNNTTTLQEGQTYTVTYTATDSYGISNSTTRTIETIPTVSNSTNSTTTQ